MFKKFLIFVCSLAILPQVFANPAPILIDLSIEGTLQNPRMEITQTELMQGAPYVLVMVNNTDFPLVLQFEKFGQAIFTQNLKGTPHVGQEEIGLLAHSKVLWQFVPNDPGEFVFSISSNQPILNAKKIKMTVKAEPTQEIAPSPQTMEAQTVTALTEEESKAKESANQEQTETEKKPEATPAKRAPQAKNKFLGRN